MKLFNLYKRLRRIFIEGPDWLEEPPFLKYRYRSRSLLALFWIYAYYVRIFTVPGRMLITVLLLTCMYNLVSIYNPLNILTFTLLATFSVDFGIGFLFRPRLTIIREMPERVRAGTAARINYTVKNRRKIPAWNIVLDSNMRRKGLKYLDGEAAVDCIPAKGEIKEKAFLCADKRGRYKLPKPIADAAFPFCIFKWSSRERDSHSLTVYPAYKTLNSLSLPVGKKYQKQASNMISKIGESVDFFGCREFRTGDETKHIHWPSSARAGKLIVREFQEEHLSRVAVIADTYVCPGSKWRRFVFGERKSFPELEAAVSLTASLADFLAREDCIIDIFAAGPDVYHFQGGRSLACLDNILDILACLEPNLKEPIKELSPSVMAEVSGIGSTVLVLLNWDEERKLLVRNLRDSGVAVKVIIIADGKKQLDLSEAGDARLLTTQEIFDGKVKEL